MTAIAAVIAVSPMRVIEAHEDEGIIIMLEQKRGSKVKEGYGLRIL
jgi:hypothetical protein